MKRGIGSVVNTTWEYNFKIYANHFYHYLIYYTLYFWKIRGYLKKTFVNNKKEIW